MIECCSPLTQATRRNCQLFKCSTTFVISVFALYYIIHMYTFTVVRFVRKNMALYTTRRSTSTIRLLFQGTSLTTRRQIWGTDKEDCGVHLNSPLMGTLIQIQNIIIARLRKISPLFLILGWSTWVTSMPQRKLFFTLLKVSACNLAT